MPDTTNIQQPKKKRDRIGVILYLAYIAMLAGAVLLIARILWLQIFFQPRPEIAQRLTPSTTVRTIEPERGKILDCEGRLLRKGNGGQRRASFRGAWPGSSPKRRPTSSTI